ncbi:MAG: decaprenyl-phosphate phosphoribosyltransferase [Fimbriimonadaceae bacterium]
MASIITHKVRARAIIRLLRPKQWTKNLLVFAALIFAHRYVEWQAVGEALIAFAALCLLSSATYAANDALDIKRDRVHPTKRTRPLAAGELTVQAGWGAAFACAVAGLGLSLFLNLWFVALAGLYLLMQIAYNLKVKQVAVLDISFLSLGYILRAVMGAVAIEATISGWLLFCTGTLALLLAAGKRRHEFLLLGTEAATRPSLRGYNQTTLDAFVVVSAALAILSYGVYAIESSTAIEYPALVLTVPFVAFGVMRYLHLSFGKNEGGEPETVVFDPQILLSIVGFLAFAFAALGGMTVPFIEN